jgi:5'-methylthioadenosine phosphorylase
MTMLGIIGGRGLQQIQGLGNVRRRVVRTPYGEASGALTFGELGGRPVCFLARHGYGHTLTPQAINYRANLWALREVGVTQIIAVATVGSLHETLEPGALVVPDQIVDYTWNRKHTFFDTPDRPVIHIDFTEPYDQTLRERLLTAGRLAGVMMQDGGTYGCTEGPRLETAAEIRRMRRDGCDLVGMTGMPEAALSREIELAYAALCIVVNHAAGVGQSRHIISTEAMRSVVDGTMASVQSVLLQLASGPA